MKVLLQIVHGVYKYLFRRRFSKIRKNALFRFTNMKLWHFNGLIVSTHRYSEINEIEPFDIKNQGNAICYTQILNPNISANSICNKNLWKKKINNLRSYFAGHFQESYCYVKGRLKLTPHCNENYKMNKIFSPEIISLFGAKSIKNLTENQDDLLEKFLILERHDFVISPFRVNIVTKIEKHEQNSFTYEIFDLLLTVLF